jgi:hypothetical protein
MHNLHTSCSAATSTSNASISNSIFVVSPTGMDTDSCEFDAAKYDELHLGFTSIGSSAFPQPRCVICAKVLSHNSMRPSLGHLESKHANLKNKPREVFER